MAGGAKERLVNFIDRKALAPVLEADPGSFPERKRDDLRDVQEATRAERERFRNYGSAEQVYEMFRNDLSSDAAKKVHRKLRDLGLPTLDDIEDDVEEMAKDAGIRN